MNSFTFRATVFLLLIVCCGSTSLAQGLRFEGNNVPIEQRASYAVFNKAPSVSTELIVEFNLNILNLTNSGYVFRLSDPSHALAYNFTYTYFNDASGLLKFNEEGKDNVLSIEVDNALLQDRDGLRLRFVFSIPEQRLHVVVNGKTYTADHLFLPKVLHPSISFGCDNYNIDITSFTLRQLMVKCDNTEHQFPFNESKGEDVHNMEGKVVGTVIKPKWMINDRYHWQLRYSFSSKTVVGSCFDTTQQSIFLFNHDSIVYFNLKNSGAIFRPYANKLPVDVRLGTSFLDPSNNNIYVYEVNDLPNGSTTIASLDLHSLQWTPVSTDFLPMQLHHHGGYWHSASNSYYVFGGFGNQQYNRNLLKLDPSSGRWDTLAYTGSPITPRYFTSMSGGGPMGRNLYIFGGMGNEAGDHTIGRKYYYDLYKIDLESMHATKLWDLDWTAERVVPVRSLIMPNDSVFYALCYPEHVSSSFLRLYRFSMLDGSHEILADSIPIRSDGIKTNANIYYNAKLKELYCVVLVIADDGQTACSLYSLAFPPIAYSELQTYDKEGFNPMGLLLGIIVFVLLGIALLLAKRRSSSKDPSNGLPAGEHPSNDLPSNELPVNKLPVNDAPTNEPPSKTILPAPNIDIGFQLLDDVANSIYLFGEFALYDRNGKDITYMLSTRLRHTFILILQHSVLKEGISSQRLTEALWPDRDDPSLKNLRGVTLNQLRKIIAELDGVELLYNQGVFKLQTSGKFYCDYASFHSLCSANAVDGNHQAVLGILLRGRFLRSFPEDAFFNQLDGYVRSLVLSIVPHMIERCFEQSNFIATIHLCDALFITDPLNELALQCQLRSLEQLQLVDEAKRRQALFAARYKLHNKRDYTM